MNTIIEKIRAEVNRLQHTDIPHTDEWWDGADYVRRRMKDVLSDLEKSENPINPQPVKDNALFDSCLAKVNPETREEVRKNIDKMIEQPVYEELGEEINRWMGSTDCFPEGVGISPLPKAMEIVERTARHFYELGRQSKPTTAEGLDEEITEFIANHYEVDYYDGLQHHGKYLDTYDVEDIARHFAQWGAEHLKK